MITGVLVLAAVLGQVPSSDFYMDEVPSKPPVVTDARFGGGTLFVGDVKGAAPSGEAGLEFRSLGPVALRMTLGAAARLSWGALYLTPEAVYRFLPREARFSPYVSLGAFGGLMNVRDEAFTGGHRKEQGQLSSAIFGEKDYDANPGGGAAPPGSALSPAYGPQLQAGLRVRTFGATALDLGLRYSLIRWEGDTYRGMGVVLTVCAPTF